MSDRTAAKLQMVVERNAMNAVWRAEKGVGSFVVVDCGEKVEVALRNDRIAVQGSFHVWIQYCSWVMKDEDATMLCSETVSAVNQDALRRLVGKYLMGIRCHGPLQYTLEFSGGLAIVVSADLDAYGEEADLFTLYEADESWVAVCPARGAHVGDE